MHSPKRPVNAHKAYHAHVYFEEETLEIASTLCQKAGNLFNLKVGRVHQKPVGPHPKWSCQITFDCRQFDELVPWLDNNREGLSILIHALTGNDMNDHTSYAYWLGDSIELDLSLFKADKSTRPLVQ